MAVIFLNNTDNIFTDQTDDLVDPRSTSTINGDNLVFIQTILLIRSQGWEINDNLNLKSAQNWGINQANYPLIITPDPADIVIADHITIGDNLSGATIQLRNPEFGNTDKYQQTRILRDTIGQDLIIFRDTNWPTEDILNYSFYLLNQRDADAFLKFTNDFLGNLLTLTDYDGHVYQGFILNPEKEQSQEGRFQYNCSFDFQIAAVNS